MPSTRPPHVLFIFTDEWRVQATGYAGDPNCETPRLDAFARDSLEVTHAVSGCPVCCPYRASLMTGQRPLTHGVFINDVELNPQAKTIARAFKAGGYHTGYIGKWHLYGSPEGRNERRRHFVPRSHQAGFDEWLGFECNHDYTKGTYFHNDDPVPRAWADYPTACDQERQAYEVFPQTQAALDYMRNRRDAGQPFLCMLSWGPPHFPLHSAPASCRQRYEHREIILRPNVPPDLREAAQAELRGYYAHIAALDHAFGMLLDGLAELGLADDTIIVFTSDHGDMRQSQGLETKCFPWDESIRVPFLIRDPRHRERHGARLDALIDAQDLMPTLLGLCDLPIPTTVEGRNWRNELDGTSAVDPDHDAVLGLAGAITELCFNGMSAWRGLRTLRYTYARNEAGPWLCYDNQTDPYQMRNLVSDPAQAGLIQALDARLLRRLRACGDTFESGAVLLERAGLSHYRETLSPLRQVWSDPWARSG
jgi:arylsulfatase A-like enzyme